jgi:hypothetical protein
MNSAPWVLSWRGGGWKGARLASSHQVGGPVRVGSQGVGSFVCRVPRTTPGTGDSGPRAGLMSAGICVLCMCACGTTAAVWSVPPVGVCCCLLLFVFRRGCWVCSRFSFSSTNCSPFPQRTAAPLHPLSPLPCLLHMVRAHGRVQASTGDDVKVEEKFPSPADGAGAAAAAAVPAPAAAGPKSMTAGDAPPPVPFFSLFKYATTAEVIVLWLAAFGCVLNGAVLPAFSVLFGLLLDNLNADNFVSAVNRICLAFTIIGTWRVGFGALAPVGPLTHGSSCWSRVVLACGGVLCPQASLPSCCPWVRWRCSTSLPRGRSGVCG